MSQTKKAAKSRKSKIASIIIGIVILVIAVILITQLGTETSPPDNTNDDLTSSQTLAPAQQVSQTDQPQQTELPTATPQPTEPTNPAIDLTQFDGPYDVAYVLDGDTIIADIDGDHIKIRLIGIDCPESVHYDERENTAAGELASDFAKSLLENNQVWLEYDIERFDQYERTLAYVYTAQHGMINDYMLNNGYATVVVYPPNVKYVDRFEQSMNEAEDSGAGLWGM